MKSFRLSTQIRQVSSFSKKKDTLTPFPTKFHPVKSASKTKINLPQGVVHNPPASAPSPYQTPAAFLPKDDPRRTAVWNKQVHNIETMPPLVDPAEKSYHLNESDIKEIQKLRLEDPEKWTRKALAEKFQCSPFFISMVSTPDQGRDAEMNSRLETIKSSWTEHRANSRRDRTRRREVWLRDM